MANEVHDTAALERDGFVFVQQLLAPRLCEELASAVDSSTAAGQRHLLDHPSVIGAISGPVIADAVHAVIGGRPFAFKATLFDKSADTNWLVA